MLRHALHESEQRSPDCTFLWVLSACKLSYILLSYGRLYRVSPKGLAFERQLLIGYLEINVDIDMSK